MSAIKKKLSVEVSLFNSTETCTATLTSYTTLDILLAAVHKALKIDDDNSDHYGLAVCFVFVFWITNL